MTLVVTRGPQPWWKKQEHALLSMSRSYDRAACELLIHASVGGTDFLPYISRLVDGELYDLTQRQMARIIEVIRAPSRCSEQAAPPTIDRIFFGRLDGLLRVGRLTEARP